MRASRYLIVGTVPHGSLASALAGRTVALPADSLGEVAARLAEAVRAGIHPHAFTTQLRSHGA